MLNREARISDADRAGLHTQERYESIVTEMTNLRLKKVIEYGEARYTEHYPLRQSKAVLWANLQRKFQRATNDLIDHPDRPVSRDTYLDMANYALMVLEVGAEEGWA